MSFNYDEESKTSREFKLGYYQASVNSSLFYLKAILILNAGALASILVAVSRSVTEGFAITIMGSADCFMWGLACALFSIFYFVPVAEGMEGFEAQIKRHWIVISVMVLSGFISLVLFIYGTWSTVSALEEFFHAGQSATL